MSAEQRTCEDCKWCLAMDYGWSNWTTEGTYVYCTKGLHPAKFGFDRWYGEDTRLLFAQQCEGFTAGEMVSVDCDQEEAPYNSPEPWWTFYTQDEEQREAIAVWTATQPEGDPAPEDEGKP